MKKVLINILDESVLGVFTDVEFTHKVRKIAVENDDEGLSIIVVGEATDYIDEYCENLKWMNISFDAKDILRIGTDLGMDVSDEQVDYVFLNYNENDDPTSTWTEIVENLLYGYESNEEEFEFYVDEKITTWKRTPFTIQAKDLKSAKEKAISFYKEDGTDDLEWHNIEGVDEKMSIEENDNEATAELYYNNEFIYKNTNK